MKRSWTLWLVFAGCAIIVLAAMAWVSMIVLQLEDAGARSGQLALLEENTRLALWRMESMLAPFIAQENARPYYSYQAFFPAERAYTRMLSRLEPNEILIPSPLLKEGSSYVRLYFQLGPGGELSSPQIPTAQLNEKAVEGYSDDKQIEESTRRLKEFAGEIPRQALLDVAPAEWLPMERPNGLANKSAPLREAEGSSALASEPEPALAIKDKVMKKGSILAPKEIPAPQAQPQVNLAREVITNSPAQVANQVVTVPNQQEQQLRNEAEYQARLSNTQRDALWTNKQARKQVQDENQKAKTQLARVKEESIADPVVTSAVAGKTAATDQELKLSQEKRTRKADVQSDPIRTKRRSIISQQPEIKISLLKPAWIHNKLILVRRVRINQDELLQGCLLDWPRLQSWLIAGIRDLLPQARLVAGINGSDQARSLAALPLVIQPGQLSTSLPTLVSPLRFSLWVAWFCVIAAILATALLFRGTHALSERRAAFVSAVTHELRTPLTTFRIYTEMLAEDMVPEAEQRRQYLNTLKQEADRQYHLIENVLAYSRLEKGRYGEQKETIDISAWLERVQPRLAELTERSGMIIVSAEEKDTADLQIRTDVAALERILFNLVDNACKYARSAADKRIHIEVSRERKRVRIRVRDHGPGIAAKDVTRLFQPFHKSARDAANSAPGVGLGLSLCRRLAQSIGGELTLEQNSDDGAAFSLLLPRLQES
jgi:signal transduction histidine kinase